MTTSAALPPRDMANYYRISTWGDGQWCVRWLLGSKYVLVHGPCTYSEADDWFKNLNQTLRRLL